MCTCSFPPPSSPWQGNKDWCPLMSHWKVCLKVLCRGQWRVLLNVPQSTVIPRSLFLGVAFSVTRPGEHQTWSKKLCTSAGFQSTPTGASRAGSRKQSDQKMKDEQESELISCLDLKHFMGILREVRVEKHYKHKFRMVVSSSSLCLFTDCSFANFDDHLFNKSSLNDMSCTSTLTCPKTRGNGSGEHSGQFSTRFRDNP